MQRRERIKPRVWHGHVSMKQTKTHNTIHEKQTLRGVPGANVQA